MISSEYDVIILGLGPAGLQAAVHAARRKASVLLLGQIEKSSLFVAHIENYLSLFNLTGEEMLQRGMEQARRFGAEILQENVIGIEMAGDRFRVRTEGGRRVAGWSLILATGSKRNRLGVPGEKALLGKGVSYCVDCDGLFFSGAEVCITGNESAAVDGALTLVKSAATVHLVCESLQVAEALKNELLASPVVLHENRRIEAIEGNEAVEAIRLDDGTRMEVQGVFIEQGAKGVLEIALNIGVRLDDEMKYIQTNKQQETSVPGIFAAGDICGMPWQMAKAVGEGCIAGIGAAAWAKSRKRQTD